MQTSDFDVESLAAYLHILPVQVTKMAERGKLPGRKVAGQWRFSVGEIHHWLEDRIGLSDDDGLASVERILESRTPATSELSLADVITPDAIAVPLVAKTRNSVITSMVELAAETGWLWDSPKMVEAIKTREELHPTALDNGVALLHPRRPQNSILAQAIIVVGVTTHGLPFGGAASTDLFFLIAATSDVEHLQLLARVSRIVANNGLLADLRCAGSANEVYNILTKADAELVGSDLPD